MPERLKVDNPTSDALWFAIAAMVRVEKRGVDIPRTAGTGYIDVEMRVNGVEVSFRDTIADIYARMRVGIKDEAARMVRETVEFKGLDDLRDLIEKSRWAIREKIEGVFGVDLDDS